MYIYMYVYIYVCVCIYIYMVVDQNSFIWERPWIYYLKTISVPFSRGSHHILSDSVRSKGSKMAWTLSLAGETSPKIPNGWQSNHPQMVGLVFRVAQPSTLSQIHSHRFVIKWSYDYRSNWILWYFTNLIKAIIVIVISIM
jgi:hypothetical protein